MGQLNNGANQNTASGVVTIQSGAPYITSCGSQGIPSSSTGTGNSGFGYQALGFVSTGGQNTAVGFGSMGSVSTGSNNSALGYKALAIGGSGTGNTAMGALSLDLLSGGSNNVAVGYQALNILVTGNNNTCIGNGAGIAYTNSESSNICIGNGVSGIATESNTIRIGSGTTSCYITGIAGVTVANVVPVVINSSTGQLGTTSGFVAAWISASSSTTIVPGNGYYANSASLVQFTLPSTPTVGSIFKLIGISAGGWSIGQTGSQTIIYGNKSTTAGSSGSLASSAIGDSVEILYTGSNTFAVLSSVGNLAVS